MLGASCRDPLERRAIVRSAFGFVKRQTTIYCAPHFGHMQYMVNCPTESQVRPKCEISRSALGLDGPSSQRLTRSAASEAALSARVAAKKMLRAPSACSAC